MKHIGWVRLFHGGKDSICQGSRRVTISSLSAKKKDPQRYNKNQAYCSLLWTDSRLCTPTYRIVGGFTDIDRLDHSINNVHGETFAATRPENFDWSFSGQFQILVVDEGSLRKDEMVFCIAIPPQVIKSVRSICQKTLIILRPLADAIVSNWKRLIVLTNALVSLLLGSPINDNIDKPVFWFFAQACITAPSFTAMIITSLTPAARRASCFST